MGKKISLFFTQERGEGRPQVGDLGLSGPKNPPEDEPDGHAWLQFQEPSH